MQRSINSLSIDTAETLVQPIVDFSALEEHLDIEVGQDYEIVVDFHPREQLKLDEFYSHLSEMGTSIQIAEGEQIYRMHIHVPTKNRYKPIDYVMELGNVSKVFIENLILQTENQSGEVDQGIELPEVVPGQIAVVTVSPGLGISKIFASLGVAAIVEGGQTMNPSTEELLNSFDELPTDKVIILPNNKNIVMAAQAAAESSIKNVEIVPSISIPQGLNAMLRLSQGADFENIVEEMKDALQELETGEITIANRDVEVNGVHVKKGEVIALLNGNLVCSSESIEEACMYLLNKANTEEYERVTLYYGNNISSDSVKQIEERIHQEYPSHEIEIHNGGQPHYHFIIAIE